MQFIAWPRNVSQRIGQKGPFVKLETDCALSALYLSDLPAKRSTKTGDASASPMFLLAVCGF